MTQIPIFAYLKFPFVSENVFVFFDPSSTTTYTSTDVGDDGYIFEILNWAHYYR